MNSSELRTGDATDRRVELSALDLFEYPIPIDVAFVFRRAVDPDALRESLRETLRHYPELTGRLRSEGNGLFVECNDRGATFATDTADIAVADLAEGDFAHVPMKPYFARNAWLRACNRDVPLFVVTHTTTACGGMILTLEAAHALMDGESMVALVRNWARIHRGDEARVSDMERADYEPFFDVRAPAKSDPDRVPGFKRMSRSMLLWKVVKLAWDSRSTVSVVLEFSKPELKRLKRATNAPAHFALLALVWQTLARLRPNRDDDATALFMVVGTRHLHDRPVERGYRGNAVWHVRAESTYGEVRGAALEALTAQVQAAHTSVDYDGVKTGMQWLANERERGNLTLGVVPEYELMRRDFFATNMALLRLYSPNFGTGKPAWVTTREPPIRWMIRLFPRPNGRGVNVHCTVPRAWKKILAADEVQQQLHRYADPA